LFVLVTETPRADPVCIGRANRTISTTSSVVLTANEKRRTTSKSNTFATYAGQKYYYYYYAIPKENRQAHGWRTWRVGGFIRKWKTARTTECCPPEDTVVNQLNDPFFSSPPPPPPLRTVSSSVQRSQRAYPPLYIPFDTPFRTVIYLPDNNLLRTHFYGVRRRRQFFRGVT